MIQKNGDHQTPEDREWYDHARKFHRRGHRPAVVIAFEEFNVLVDTDWNEIKRKRPEVMKAQIKGEQRRPYGENTKQADRRREEQPGRRARFAELITFGHVSPHCRRNAIDARRSSRTLPRRGPECPLRDTRLQLRGQVPAHNAPA